jgi:ABC-type sugar transport system substrate-binding protein
MSAKYRRHAMIACLGLLAMAASACSVSEGGSGSGGSGGSSQAAGKAANASVPSWCGSKKVSLGLADGFGDNNWRQVTSAEAKAEIAKCPNVTSYSYADGQGNTQKAISDIQGLVAKGVQGLVVFPDAGQAVLPALRSAHQAGVTTVPYRVSPGGQAGTDYDAFVSTDFRQAGVLWAQWLVKTLHGKGNVLNLGGPPANSQSLDEYQGMQSVFKNYPGIKFVGTTPYSVTNWDAAQTQKVVTAALAKYPKIDAITTDFGAALASSFSAFAQAGRKIPAIATEDANVLACAWQKDKDAGKEFPLFTVNSQNAMSRLAVDVAVAKASGGVVPKSTVFPQTAFEDSVSGKPHPVTCDKSLPMDAFVSSTLTQAQQTAALK